MLIKTLIKNVTCNHKKVKKIHEYSCEKIKI